MYSDDDPHLADVRRVCLDLPEAVEVEAWGRPTFRAGRGKMFAVFQGDDEHPYAVIFKPDPEERPALLQDERFYAPAYYGPSGWLAIDLSRGEPDWQEFAELMATSYRKVAIKRQLRALDGGG
jgi:predicted DNA-binding protein (MmcQ/YjbR family)